MLTLCLSGLDSLEDGCMFNRVGVTTVRNMINFYEEEEASLPYPLSMV